jgi:IclR family KDG regulon transcriptional repressor
VSSTVAKALKIVEAMSRIGEPVGISQIGRELRLNKSTVFRLLDTLCRHGFARKDPQTNTYHLTTRLWELGVGVLQQNRLRDLARPTMEAVTRETDETTMLGIIQDDEALIVEKVSSRAPLQIASPVGTRVPLHCSSIGRSLLAFMGEDAVDRLCRAMPRRTDRTITTRAALQAELARIRAAGVCECIDEWAVGVSGVAAPVRDHSGAVVGSLCITGPTLRLAPERLAKLRPRVVGAAREISALLGHREPAGTRSRD